MTASMVSQVRIARRRANVLGLRVTQRAGVVDLRDADGDVLVVGLAAVEVYPGERYTAQRPGPAMKYGQR